MSEGLSVARDLYIAHFNDEPISQLESDVLDYAINGSIPETFFVGTSEEDVMEELRLEKQRGCLLIGDYTLCKLTISICIDPIKYVREDE